MATRAPAKKAAPVKKPAPLKKSTSATKAAPVKKARPAEAAGGAQESAEVAAFLQTLAHPRKAEVQALRALILGVDPSVREAIKWNAPSFHTTEHFATFNLRGKDGVRLVLHTGAKLRETARDGVKVEDPAGLLEWLAPDRCLVTFADAADVRARGPALQALLREWLRAV